MAAALHGRYRRRECRERLVPGDIGGGSGGLWIHCNSYIRRFETVGAKATVEVAYIAGNGWYR